MRNKNDPFLKFETLNLDGILSEKPSYNNTAGGVFLVLLLKVTELEKYYII
jgi:hypothetical protein